ncbi:DinB family protein [Actinotalea sp. C106]|uniref:mycothiol transferase n=1 Tax=Actinotalea sp. C106 TaxID=2908644 RepID=UPI002027FE3F|nr:DinB family protein [Actinotalea sp. C106]
MDVREILTDGFDRVREEVVAVLDGIAPTDVDRVPAPGANTIAWLVWHLSRVQDDHVADAFAQEQVWTEGWAERFGLDLPRLDTGFGHGPAEVEAVRVSPDLLVGYHEAVHARTVELLRRVGARDLDRVVDEAWDPPVTLGARLVSVISDDLQHVGQAAYLRGLLQSPRS